jgi:uncharacterized repeat protein (TIGR03833 family)
VNLIILDGKNLDNVKIGSTVKIKVKTKQDNYETKEGCVKEILTRSKFHPHGIKVILNDGTIGRVEEVKEGKVAADHKSQIEPTPTITQVIAGGENQTVEFKSTLSYDLKRFQKTGTKAISKEMEKSIAKTVAAFMNSNGGYLYIGIDDDGRILGLDEDYSFLDKPNFDRFKLKLKRCIESYLKKKIIFEYINIELLEVEGKEICKIGIKSSPDPVFLHDANKQECYVRVDNESAQYSTDEFFEYWKLHISKDSI